tara:strand:+ start:44 stop:799 length:756 start_codon:yes stop_codon:yes gene_type:complete
MARITKKKSSPLADYIRPKVDAKYRTRSEAAEDIGIDESILSRICSGQRPGVSDKIIELICKPLGLDKTEGVLRLFLSKHRKMSKYFAKSQKPISFRILHANPDEKTINPKNISNTHTSVPIVDIKDFIQSNFLTMQAKDHALVPKEMAPIELLIKCCKINNDSMAPTLPEGCIIAVDSNIRRPQHGKLFLLSWKKEIIVRRILIKDKYLLFLPDNPCRDKYNIEVCTIKKAKSDKDNLILGKVIWSMGNP